MGVTHSVVVPQEHIIQQMISAIWILSFSMVFVAVCVIIKSVVNQRRRTLEVRWSITDRDGRRHDVQISYPGKGPIDHDRVVEVLAHSMLTSPTPSTHNNRTVTQ